MSTGITTGKKTAESHGGVRKYHGIFFLRKKVDGSKSPGKTTWIDPMWSRPIVPEIFRPPSSLADSGQMGVLPRTCIGYSNYIAHWHCGEGFLSFPFLFTLIPWNLAFLLAFVYLIRDLYDTNRFILCTFPSNQHCFFCSAER